MKYGPLLYLIDRWLVTNMDVSRDPTTHECLLDELVKPGEVSSTVSIWLVEIEANQFVRQQ